jgi:hypothetical protein
VELVDSETLSADHWRVRLKTTDGALHSVEIQAKPSDFEIFESTANTQKNHITQYHCVNML